MGALGDRMRGLRFLAGYLGGTPWMCRTLARLEPESGRAWVRGFAERHLERAGVQVRISGRENLPDTGYVFTYNECSMLDLPVNQACFWGEDLVDRGVTVPAWGRVPWFRAAATSMGIEILPKGRPAVDALMNQFADEARAGRRILWGGEGGLSGVDGVKPFKTGGARIAIRGQVPIVPVAVRGGQTLLPLGGLRLQPGTMHVSIGAPVPTEGLTEDDAKDLAARVQEAVAKLYEALPSGLER